MGPNSLEVARLLNLMADSYWSTPKLQIPLDYNNYEKAQTLNRRALAIHVEVCGTDSREVLEDCLAIARLCSRLDKHRDAEEMLTRALKVYTALDADFAAHHHDESYVLSALASHYEEQEEPVHAEEFFKRAVASKEQAYCRSHRKLGMTLDRLANFYCEHGEFSDAEKIYLRLVAMNERTFGQNNVQVIVPLEAYGKFLYERGREPEAQEVMCRADAIRNGAD
jgi:tetratricopeptide (TPR) repeat protein